MIPKKAGPDLIRAGYRLSEKACPSESGGHAPTKRDDDSKKSHHALGYCLSHRLEHLLWRPCFDDEGLAGLDQALEARQDQRPALTTAGQDRLGDVPRMRLSHGQAHRSLQGVDLERDQAFGKLAHVIVPFDAP